MTLTRFGIGCGFTLAAVAASVDHLEAASLHACHERDRDHWNLPPWLPGFGPCPERNRWSVRPFELEPDRAEPDQYPPLSRPFVADPERVDLDPWTVPPLLTWPPIAEPCDRNHVQPEPDPWPPLPDRMTWPSRDRDPFDPDRWTFSPLFGPVLPDP